MLFHFIHVDLIPRRYKSPVLRAIAVLTGNGQTVKPACRSVESVKRINVAAATQVEEHECAVALGFGTLGQRIQRRCVGSRAEIRRYRRPAGFVHQTGCHEARTEIAMIRIVDAGFSLAVQRVGIPPVENGDEFVGRHQRVEFGDDFAVRSRIGRRIISILIIESDSVQTVFFHSMGQDLGELCGLGIVHVGDTDALPVAQHGQQHLDALVLQRFHVSLITAVFA